MEKTERKPGEPYCSNCGYSLVGATESAVCPECGRPLVDVLVRHTITQRFAGRVVRYESRQKLFGAPVISVAFGPRPEFGERMGRARGIIAVGDQAIGGIAVGGMTCGVVAVGGVSVGVASLGGMAIGVGTALGGGAVGGYALGGGAAGGLASGGGAIGFVAQGGVAVGYYARGGEAIGVHTRQGDAAAQRMFTTLEPVMGPFGGNGAGQLTRPLVCIVGIDLALAAAVALLALVAYGRGVNKTRENPYAPARSPDR